MKTISLSVSLADYEAFKRAAKAQGRPVAQLIREAMAHYRAVALEERTALVELPVLPGHGATGEVPPRDALWDEVFQRTDS